MTAAADLLPITVLGMVMLAIAVDLAVMIGWLRRMIEREP